MLGTSPTQRILESLARQKPDRGFESPSLRHAVWVAEKPGAFPKKSLEIAAIPQFFFSNWTGEGVALERFNELSRLFLQRAHAQSGFNKSIRRTQGDHKPMAERKGLDSVTAWSLSKLNSRILLANAEFRLFPCRGRGRRAIHRARAFLGTDRNLPKVSAGIRYQPRFSFPERLSTLSAIHSLRSRKKWMMAGGVAA